MERTDSTVALTAFPLSSGFRQRLEAAAGTTPLYVSLTELRRRPPIDALRFLRSLRGCRLLLVFESGERAQLRPLLESIAAAASPRSVEVLGPDLSRSTVSRWHALPALASLVRASVDGRLAVRDVERELERLVAEPRIAARWDGGRRVLYLNATLWIGLKVGGSIGHVAGVVNGLRGAAFDVELATVVEPIGIDPTVGVRSLAPPVPFGLPAETNGYRFQRSLAAQLRGAAAARPAFVYQRMSAANYGGVALSRRLGVPYVLEYNGSEVWVADNWGTGLRYRAVALLAEEACLKHAHVVVTVSDALRRELVERGVEPGRIMAHPNGVDPAVFDPARFGSAEVARVRATHGIEADAIVVGFVGTFGLWHGAEVLARAIARIAADDVAFLGRRNVRFLLVGDGLRQPAVREIVEGTAAASFVRLPGLVPQADAPLHLAACDVLVSPHVPNADGSEFFGSPTKLFEYMAMGRAIVASRLGQIGDVLNPALDAGSLPGSPPSGAEREVAVLATPGDVEELVDGLRFLVDAPEWRRTLGANARAAVLSRYTWAHHVEAFLERLHDTAGSGNGSDGG
jgi:glycosyltransferase involved in cell wall biosynthesis